MQSLETFESDWFLIFAQSRIFLIVRGSIIDDHELSDEGKSLRMGKRH